MRVCTIPDSMKVFDFIQMVSLFQKLWERENKGAMNLLGLAYTQNSYLSIQDKQNILRWLKNAAIDHKDPYAKIFFSYAYVHGLYGLIQNSEWAFEWFKESENMIGKSMLSSLYETYILGQFEESAKRGSLDSQLFLGNVYAYGKYDLPQDTTKAISFFKSAAKQKNSEAMCSLAEQYSILQENIKVVHWLEKALEGENERAILFLGQACLQGKYGLTPNPLVAKRLFKMRNRMPEQTDIPIYLLTVTFAQGKHTKQNDSKLVKLFKKMSTQFLESSPDDCEFIEVFGTHLGGQLILPDLLECLDYLSAHHKRLYLDKNLIFSVFSIILDYLDNKLHSLLAKDISKYSHQQEYVNLFNKNFLTTYDVYNVFLKQQFKEETQDLETLERNERWRKRAIFISDQQKKNLRVSEKDGFTGNLPVVKIQKREFDPTDDKEPGSPKYQRI